MMWFGEEHPRRTPHCSTPVGDTCIWCKETIVEGDSGLMVAAVYSECRVDVVPIHVECQLRSVVGGPAHLLGICTCHGGEGAADTDLGMGLREAALFVWRFYRPSDLEAGWSEGGGPPEG